MKGKRPRGCSDSELQRLWREAVRKIWMGRCALKDECCEGDLECHHIKPRRIPHLRHNRYNGIVLCQYHHALSGMEKYRKIIRARVGPEVCQSLDELELVLYPEYLRSKTWTRNEHLQWARKELLECLGEGGY